jgi:hypothetical protein
MFATKCHAERGAMVAQDAHEPTEKPALGAHGDRFRPASAHERGHLSGQGRRARTRGSAPASKCPRLRRDSRPANRTLTAAQGWPGCPGAVGEATGTPASAVWTLRHGHSARESASPRGITARRCSWAHSAPHRAGTRASVTGSALGVCTASRRRRRPTRGAGARR